MIEYEIEHSDERESIYQRLIENLAFHMHLHKSYEFIYVFEGELFLQIDENEYRMEKGSAALILPNEVHSYKTLTQCKTYFCLFSHLFLYEYYEKTIDICNVKPIFAFADAEQIIQILQSENINRYMLKSVFYRILAESVEYAVYTKRNKKKNELICGIITYVEENFNGDLSLRSLAKELGYDVYYLSKIFNKIFRTNFLNFVNQYRIGHAQYLLRNTDLSVTLISSECGYNSIRSFNRNFQLLTGKTPKEYKR